MSKRNMAQVVAEFNQLSGQSIKRFATVEVGEKRIAALKAGAVADEKKQAKVKRSIVIKEEKPKAEPHGRKQRITVNGFPYRSVAVAFEELGLPMGKHIRFRSKLKASGKKTFEHEGKAYHFVNVKQESLA